MMSNVLCQSFLPRTTSCSALLDYRSIVMFGSASHEAPGQTRTSEIVAHVSRPFARSHCQLIPPFGPRDTPQRNGVCRAWALRSAHTAGTLPHTPPLARVGGGRPRQGVATGSSLALRISCARISRTLTLGCYGCLEPACLVHLWHGPETKASGHKSGSGRLGSAAHARPCLLLLRGARRAWAPH